ncbi:homeobox domain-containing protein [Trichonephila inaurata madagascariensis]|uniref:Homeobox domain-containing protein n=1 Tax=Trichonephila inaurata madagascariensis TaxID=2747483 RepID=A0A8X6Y1W4_9ARAC|nr:homeobox domain-containing protein [Trichonephila inaurata madagascariensis]
MGSYCMENTWKANGLENNSTPVSTPNSISSDYMNIRIKEEPFDDYEIPPAANSHLNENDNSLEIVEIEKVIRSIKKEPPVITLSDESNDCSQVNVQASNETNLTETCASDNLNCKSQQQPISPSKTSKEITFGNRSINLVPHVGPIFDDGPNGSEATGTYPLRDISDNVPDQSQKFEKVVAHDKNNFYHTVPIIPRVLQYTPENSVHQVENLNAPGFVSNEQFNERHEQLQTAYSYHGSNDMDTFIQVPDNATAQNQNSRRKICKKDIRRVPQNVEKLCETLSSVEQFSICNDRIPDNSTSGTSNGDKKNKIKPKKRKTSQSPRKKIKNTKPFFPISQSQLDINPVFKNRFDAFNKRSIGTNNAKETNFTFAITNGLPTLRSSDELVTESPFTSVPPASGQMSAASPDNSTTEANFMFSMTNVLPTLSSSDEQVTESPFTSVPPASGQMNAGSPDNQINHENGTEISEPVSRITVPIFSGRSEAIGASVKSTSVESGRLPTDESRTNNNSAKLVCKNGDLTNNNNTSDRKNEAINSLKFPEELTIYPQSTLKRLKLKTIRVENDCDSIYSKHHIDEFLSDKKSPADKDENNTGNSPSAEQHTSTTKLSCTISANNFLEKTFSNVLSNENGNCSSITTQGFSNNKSTLNSNDLLDHFELQSNTYGSIKDKSPENNVEATVSANERLENFLSDTASQNNTFINSETQMQSVNTKLVKVSDKGEFFYSPDGRQFYSFNITFPFITPSETCSNDINIVSKHSVDGNILLDRAPHSNFVNLNSACSVSANNTSKRTQQVRIGSNNQSQSNFESELDSTSAVNNSYQASKSEFNIWILEMRGSNANGFKLQQSLHKNCFKCENFGLFYECINFSSVELLIKELLSKEPMEKENVFLYFLPAAVFYAKSSVKNSQEERSSPFSPPSESSNSVQSFNSHIFIGFSNWPKCNVINFIIKNSKRFNSCQSDKTIPTNSSDTNESNVFSTCPIQRDIERDSLIDSNLCDATEIKKEVMNENVTSRSELSTLSTWVNGVNITSDVNVTNQDDNDDYLSDECIILEEYASASNLKPERITGSYLKYSSSNTGNTVYDTGHNSNHILSSETAESLLPVNLGSNGVPNLSYNRDINNYSTQQTSFPSKDANSQCGEQFFPHTSFNCHTQHSSPQQVPVYSNNNVVYSENILHAVNNFIMLPSSQMDMNNNMNDTAAVTVQNVNFSPNQCSRITSHNFADSQLGIPHSLPNIALHQPFGIANQLQWQTSHRTHQVKQYSGNNSNHQFDKQRYERRMMESQAARWISDEVNNPVPNNLDRNYRNSMNERGVDRSFLQTSGGNIIKESMSNGLKCVDLQPCTYPRKENTVSNDTTSFPSHNVYTFPPTNGLSLAYQPFNNSNSANVRNQNVVQKENPLNTGITNSSLDLSTHSGRIPCVTSELFFSNGTGTISNACSSVHSSPAASSDEIYGDDYQRITNQSLNPNSYEAIVPHQSYSRDNLFNPGYAGLFTHTNHVISEMPVSRYQPNDCNFPNSSLRNVLPSSSSEVVNEDTSKMHGMMKQAIFHKDTNLLSSIYPEAERLRDDMQMKCNAIHLAYVNRRYEEVIHRIQNSKRFHPELHTELQKIWVETWKHIELTPMPGKITDRHPYPDSIYVNTDKVLNDAYKEDPYPKIEKRKLIAEEVNFSEKRVNTWFKNKRQRAKKDQEELAAGRVTATRGRRRGRRPLHPY